MAPSPRDDENERSERRHSRGRKHSQPEPQPSENYDATTEGSEAEVVYVIVDDGQGNPFEERSRRMAFVRKVLGIVGLQLAFCAAVTGGAVLLTKSNTGVKNWMQKFWWIAFIALVGWICIIFPVACCGVGRGKANPLNVTLLILGTLFMSIVCAFFTAYFESEIILYALATLVSILILIVLVTVFTPLDITGCGILLFVAGLTLIIMSIICSLVIAFAMPEKNTIRIILLVVGCLFVVLISVYILYDLQLIVGGRKRRRQLSEDDWLFASLTHFGDIVFLFLQLLGVYSLAGE